MSDRLRIGTAGWSVHSRYAADIPAGGSHLERYASHLNAAEINSSFYRPHQHKTYARWAQSTPDDFRFAVKVPKAITHERKLVGCGTLLDAFAEQVAGLGEKLGVVLVQLPPSSVFKAGVAHRFFASLRRRFAAPIALEPRHASWFAAGMDGWLAKRRIARVAADPARVPQAAETGGWNGLAYYRWHGSPRMYYSEYDEAALLALRSRLDRSGSRNVPTWCIFDNTTSSAALGNALALSRLAVMPKSKPILHGIKNCDTMKKARAWLDSRGVAYAFHDYKLAGIDRATLEGWSKQVGWETLLNRTGTTFRKLPDSEKENLTEKKAIALMLAQPSMIKRPVLERGGKISVGFKPELYAQLFR